MNDFEPKVPVDISYVRSLLISNKDFLRSLYEAKRKPAILSLIQNASNEQILLLLKIFFLEANGAIKLLVQHFKVLKRYKKITLFKTHFSDEENFETLLLQDINFKRDFLKKFVPVYQVLMSPLFEVKQK